MKIRNNNNPSNNTPALEHFLPSVHKYTRIFVKKK